MTTLFDKLCDNQISANKLLTSKWVQIVFFCHVVKEVRHGFFCPESAFGTFYGKTGYIFTDSAKKILRQQVHCIVKIHISDVGKP